MQRLRGKTCVVTGAARGVGAAIARRFADEGARVVLADKNPAGAQTQADRIDGVAFPLDVADESAWAALAAAHPVIDVLVNNAGVTGLGVNGGAHDPEHASLDDWRAVHRVNLNGVFLGCRYAIRAMRAAGAGSIINIASRAGAIGVPAAAAYAASKAAVLSHTRTVALYCAQQNIAIRCNAVLPGAVLTPMWDPMIGDGVERDEHISAIAADIPMRRFGAADEVAAVCALLASDEATYMTGSEIAVDGGLNAGVS